MAADEAVELLIDGELRHKLVNHNYEIAQKYYSLEALREYLAEILP